MSSSKYKGVFSNLPSPFCRILEGGAVMVVVVVYELDIWKGWEAESQERDGYTWRQRPLHSLIKLGEGRRIGADPAPMPRLTEGGGLP